MIVREITTLCVAECTEELSLDRLYDLLEKTPQRFVVVVDSKAHRIPIGLITEHTILEQLIRRRRDPRSLMAGNIMDSRIATVRDDAPAEKCLLMPELLLGVPIFVVDEDRMLCGVLEKDNIPVRKRGSFEGPANIFPASPPEARISELKTLST